jgi:hypothetical protein
MWSSSLARCSVIFAAGHTLTWINPDTNCNAEAIKPVWVRTTLREPLARRALVQASNGQPIAHKLSAGVS